MLMMFVRNLSYFEVTYYVPVTLRADLVICVLRLLGMGFFVMRAPPTSIRLRGRYGSAMTDCQQYLALSGRSGQLEISSGITCWGQPSRSSHIIFL